MPILLLVYVAAIVIAFVGVIKKIMVMKIIAAFLFLIAITLTVVIAIALKNM